MKRILFELPFDIGDELYLCTCMGMPYDISEMDKCKGWKVTQIRIKDDGIFFDVRKNKDNSTSFIPLLYFGIIVFDNENEARNALITLKKFKKYYYDNSLEDLSTDELLEKYLTFRENQI